MPIAFTLMMAAGRDASVDAMKCRDIPLFRDIAGDSAPHYGSREDVPRGRSLPAELRRHA
jgi:hypothetical protein